MTLSHWFTVVWMSVVLIGMPTTAAAQNLTAHWEFDTVNGTTTPDAVATPANDEGTLVGNAAVDGTQAQIGSGSLLLDGNGDYVEVANSTDVDQTSNFTIAAWIKPDAIGLRQTIFSKAENGSYKQYHFDLRYNGQLRFEYENNDSASGWDFGNDNPNDGNGDTVIADWQHVAVTVSAPAPGTGTITITAYLQGQPLGSVTTTTEARTANTSLYIGLRGYTSSLPFKGRIDDARVYNKALSAAEVLGLFNGNASGGDPEVTVSVTDAAAGEAGEDGGEFTLTASPAPGSALSVNVTAGGTATGGLDYTAITTPVTIPVSGSVAVPVSVQDDLEVEGDETVILTVASGAGYTVGASDTASITITDNDSANATPSITTTTLPDATVGQFYDQTLQASGGDMPLTWSLASGSDPLPVWLTLSSTGQLSGTPTATGNVSFTPRVSDIDGDPDTQALSIAVVSAGSGGTLEDLLVWDFGTDTGNATDSASDYNVSVVTPSTLARGGGLNDGGWGYATATNAFNAIGAGESTVAGAVTGGDYFTFTVTPTAGKTLSFDSLEYGFYQQNGTGIVAEWQWSTDGFATAGNPISEPGFASLGSTSASGTGTAFSTDLSQIAGLQNVGTPVEFRLYVAHSNQYDSQGFGKLTGNDLVVRGIIDGGPIGPAPSLTDSQLATGSVGEGFSYFIQATGTPTRFDATGLPPGLRLDPRTGEISGRPTAYGAYPVTVSASNLGGSDTATLTIDLDLGDRPINLALNKSAEQVSTFPDGSLSAKAGLAVDGNTDGEFSNGSVTRTTTVNDAWWQVDLGSVSQIDTIKIWNRESTDQAIEDRLGSAYVLVSDEPFQYDTADGDDGSGGNPGNMDQPGVWYHYMPVSPPRVTTLNLNRTGRYVRIQLDKNSTILNLAEVAVLGTPGTARNLALKKPAIQSTTERFRQTPSSPFVTGFAYRSVDGNTSGNYYGDESVSHTITSDQPWWQVDLLANSKIESIEVWNSTDTPFVNVTQNFHIIASENPFTTNETLSSILQRGDVESQHVTGVAGRPTSFSLPPNKNARYVRVQIESNSAAGSEQDYLVMAEVNVLGAPTGVKNLALNKPARQSSTYLPSGQSSDYRSIYAAGRAVDGNVFGVYKSAEHINNSVSLTTIEDEAWWEVDLRSVSQIDEIQVWNRTDGPHERLGGAYVFVSDEPFQYDTIDGGDGDGGNPGILNQEGIWFYRFPWTPAPDRVTFINPNRTGRYVRVQLATAQNQLHMAEVVVIGTPGNSLVNLALNKPATQISDFPNQRHPQGPQAAKAVDGKVYGDYVNSSQNNNTVSSTSNIDDPWWQVDLWSVSNIESIEIWNRTDEGMSRLRDFYVLISDDPFDTDPTDPNYGSVAAFQAAHPTATAIHIAGQAGRPTRIGVGQSGRYVRIQRFDDNTTADAGEYIHLAEVAVLGTVGKRPESDVLVEVVSPRPLGASLTAGSGALEATVDAAIEHVRFYSYQTDADGTPLAIAIGPELTTATEGRYILTDPPLRAGVHTIVARAKSTGASAPFTAESEPVTITVYEENRQLAGNGPDRDNDGVPDHQELLHFGNLDATDNAGFLSTSDPSIDSVAPRVGSAVPLIALQTEGQNPTPAQTDRLVLNVVTKNFDTGDTVILLDRFGNDVSDHAELGVLAGNDLELTIDPYDGNNPQDPDASEHLSGINHRYIARVTDSDTGVVRDFEVFFEIDATLPVVTAEPTGGRIVTTPDSTSIDVTLSASEPDATILYSTDGGAPGTAYTGQPINLSATTVLRYRSTDPAGNVGPIGTEVYYFGHTPDAVAGFTANGAGSPTDRVACAWTQWSGSGTEPAYHVYRAISPLDIRLLEESREGGYPPPVHLRLTEGAPLAGTATSYDDLGYAPGVRAVYGVTVSAKDTDGYVNESAVSDLAEVTPAAAAPGNTDESIDRAIDWLLANQNDNGSWTGSNGRSMAATAQALNGLGRAVDGDPSARQAVLRGLAYLRGNFEENNDTIARTIDTLQRFGQDTYDLHHRLAVRAKSTGNNLEGWGLQDRYYPDALTTSLGATARQQAVIEPPKVDGHEPLLNSAALKAINGSGTVDRYGWTPRNRDNVFVSAQAYEALGWNLVSETGSGGKAQWILNEQASGSGTARAFRDNVLDTAAALLFLPFDPGDRDDAKAYLTAQQNDDGSWGPPGAGDPFLTGLCLEAMAKPVALHVYNGNADTALENMLRQRGYAVVSKADNAATADDAGGVALVWIAGDADPSVVGSMFSEVAAPVIVCNEALFDEMGMTAATGQGTATGGTTNVTIASGAIGHPLAAHKGAPAFSVLTTGDLAWGTPNAAAETIATVAADQAAIFYYEDGAILPTGRPAPGRRIGFFLKGDATALNADGEDLLDAAIRWAGRTTPVR